MELLELKYAKLGSQVGSSSQAIAEHGKYACDRRKVAPADTARYPVSPRREGKAELAMSEHPSEFNGEPIALIDYNPARVTKPRIVVVRPNGDIVAPPSKAFVGPKKPKAPKLFKVQKSCIINGKREYAEFMLARTNHVQYSAKELASGKGTSISAVVRHETMLPPRSDKKVMTNRLGMDSAVKDEASSITCTGRIGAKPVKLRAMTPRYALALDAWLDLSLLGKAKVRKF